MNANDFRIGNIITEGDDKGPVTVWGIKPDSRNHVMVNDCEIEIINPVKLTEDWINKLGFKWTPASQTFWNREWHIAKEGFVYFFKVGGTRKVRINHVHQLQNLYYSLTGNELIYENRN
jgi:hypothetical protein